MGGQNCQVGQGCQGAQGGQRVGAHAGVYSIALKRLRATLIRSGVVLKVTADNGSPFWATGSSHYSWDPSDDGEQIVEVTFVDDEACTLAASSPKLLTDAIDLLLTELVKAFLMFGFRINWNPGKPKLS